MHMVLWDSSQCMHFVEQTGGIWSGSVDALWEYVGNCELLGFHEKLKYYASAIIVCVVFFIYFMKYKGF